MDSRAHDEHLANKRRFVLLAGWATCLLVVGATLLLALAVDGCSIGGADRDDRVAEATEIATSFLVAASGRAVDRGWSLLHPEIQARVFRDDAAAYVSLMASADWDSFEWRVERTVADDPFLHFVYLDLPGGHESIPDVLTRIGDWALVAPRPDGGAEIDVRLGVPFGPSGVWALGG